MFIRFEGENRHHAERQEREGAEKLVLAYAASQGANPLPGKTLADIIRRFRASPEGLIALADSTRKEWTRWLDIIHRDLGMLSIRALNDIRTRRVFIEWRDGFQATPRKADYGIQVLRRVLAFGLDQTLTTTNVAEGIKSIYRNDRSDIIIEDDELAAILGAATPAARLAIRLAAATGLRRGDLVQLRWSDVKSNRIERPTNKSRGRAVAICPLAGDAGVVVAELREIRQALVDAGNQPNDSLLVTEKGTPWKPDSLTQAFDRAASTVGIKKTLNDLRGTAATKYSQDGIPNAQIATFLGWEPSKVDRIITRYVNAESLARVAIDRQNGGQSAG